MFGIAIAIESIYCSRTPLIAASITIETSQLHKTNSHWEGIFDTENKEQLTFKGRDMNKNGKFVVLRTFFTNSKALGWINGLVCILSGEFDTSTGIFKSTGYELTL